MLSPGLSPGSARAPAVILVGTWVIAGGAGKGDHSA